MKNAPDHLPNDFTGSIYGSDGEMAVYQKGVKVVSIGKLGLELDSLPKDSPPPKPFGLFPQPPAEEGFKVNIPPDAKHAVLPMPSFKQPEYVGIDLTPENPKAGIFENLKNHTLKPNPWGKVQFSPKYKLGDVVQPEITASHAAKQMMEALKGVGDSAMSAKNSLEIMADSFQVVGLKAPNAGPTLTIKKGPGKPRPKKMLPDHCRLVPVLPGDIKRIEVGGSAVTIHNTDGGGLVVSRINAFGTRGMYDILDKGIMDSGPLLILID